LTLASIYAAANDPELTRRVESCVQQEAFGNEGVKDSEYAVAIRNGTANVRPLVWAVATSTEAAYYAALQAGRGAPGHDTDIITDGDILSVVQANWPPNMTNPAF